MLEAAWVSLGKSQRYYYHSGLAPQSSHLAWPLEAPCPPTKSLGLGCRRGAGPWPLGVRELGSKAHSPSPFLLLGSYLSLSPTERWGDSVEGALQEHQFRICQRKAAGGRIMSAYLDPRSFTASVQVTGPMAPRHVDGAFGIFPCHSQRIVSIPPSLPPH